MNNFLQNSVFFGVFISIITYEIGVLIKKKLKIAIFNPLLISMALIIIFLLIFHVDYDTYESGAKYLSYFLTPATVALAVPLYEQIEPLKKNWKAILAGIFAGAMTSALCVLVLSLIFKLSHKQYVTLLPKSITTAIGMGLSEELGGIVTITVAVIIVTGVIGNMFAENICKLFHISDPVAKGVGIGSASHAMGTSKAMEMGEIEGAMSSLSIAVSGLMTVVVSLNLFTYLLREKKEGVMALQFVLGSSGSGKTEYIYERLVRQAGEHPKKNYLVIVPEQFTMQTQQKLVELAPNHAIMNIDVLSFKRLAYRVFDDLGMQDIQVLEETGKNLVLRKLAQEQEETLTVLRANMNRMGYIGEVKSMISELVQYRISPEQLVDLTEDKTISPVLSAKLRDVATMYRAFCDFMKDSFVTAEEILNVLKNLVPQSETLRDAVLVFDEFTGFTPIQNDLMRELLQVTEHIYITLTIDAAEDFIIVVEMKNYLHCPKKRFCL